MTTTSSTSYHSARPKFGARPISIIRWRGATGGAALLALLMATGMANQAWAADSVQALPDGCWAATTGTEFTIDAARTNALAHQTTRRMVGSLGRVNNTRFLLNIWKPDGTVDGCLTDLVGPATVKVLLALPENGVTVTDPGIGWVPADWPLLGDYTVGRSFQAVWNQVSGHTIVDEGTYSLEVYIEVSGKTSDGAIITYRGDRSVALVYGSYYEAALVVHGTWLAANYPFDGDELKPISLVSPAAGYVRILYTPAVASTVGMSFEIFPAAGVSWSGDGVTDQTAHGGIYGGLKMNPLDLKLKGFDTNLALGYGFLWATDGQTSFFFGLSTASPIVSKNAKNFSVPTPDASTSATPLTAPR